MHRVRCCLLVGSLALTGGCATKSDPSKSSAKPSGEVTKNPVPGVARPVARPVVADRVR